MADDGWKDSANAWIASMGETGDFSRAHVLDAPVLQRVARRKIVAALDAGCGEGRFCRLLNARGISAIGIDPTEALIAEARRRDPQGEYRIGRAETLNFPDATFDLVISYLTLIDIPDYRGAISEMARVLKPGGALLIASLASHYTASPDAGWTRDARGEPLFRIDNYLEERAAWVIWDGIRIVNWHRPLKDYMSALLSAGLTLTHFDEPRPTGGDPMKSALYSRVPWFVVMEWEKVSG